MTPAFQPPPGFKGLWTPACIQLDHDLQPLQKMVLAEIYTLQQNKDERCWATNAHLCGIVGTSERNLRYLLAPLEQTGLLLRHGRNSRRRKLALAKHVIEAIKADSQLPVTGFNRDRPSPPPASDDVPELSAIITNEAGKITNEILTVRNRRLNFRHDPASSDDEPGNLRTDPETDFRQTRQTTTTKNTLRVQREKTDKKTTNNNMGNLDFSFSGKSASTHLLDQAGNKLVRMHVWEDWMDHQNNGWLVDKKASDQEQIAILARMVGEGFDGDALLMECKRSGLDTFWEEPPPHLIPKLPSGEIDVAA